MAKNKINRNDKPVESFDELKNEVKYSTFPHENEFKHICQLLPNIEKEKLDIKCLLSKEDLERKGLVFIFVIGDRIYKIGETRTSIKSRIRSFNCGKKKNSRTASTGNYYDLQSLLNIGRPVEVYAKFAEKMRYNFFLGPGEDICPTPPEMKKKIIDDFKKKYQKIPLSNDINRKP